LREGDQFHKHGVGFRKKEVWENMLGKGENCSARNVRRIEDSSNFTNGWSEVLLAKLGLLYKGDLEVTPQEHSLLTNQNQFAIS
jgi:hypothetical protein